MTEQMPTELPVDMDEVSENEAELKKPESEESEDGKVEEVEETEN